MAVAMPQPTRVWYLELSDPADLRPAPVPEGDVRVVRAEVPMGALTRFFYEQVGRGHHWVDLLDWPLERWQQLAERVETWLIWERGTPAGYAELSRAPGGAVDVPHFGLLEPFRGHGLGGHLLTEAVRRAWELGASKVRLSTCELDGPGALPNYQARGFRVVREVIEQRRREGEPR